VDYEIGVGSNVGSGVGSGVLSRVGITSMCTEGDAFLKIY